MKTRIEALQQRIAPAQACLLSQTGDVTYFSNFHFLVPEEREALMLITPHQAYLFHGRFCPVAEVKGITTIVASTPLQLGQELQKLQSELHLSTILIDKSSLFVDEYEALQQVAAVQLESLPPELMWHLRMYKDAQEIKYTRQAGQIAAKSFSLIKSMIVPGMTEQAVQRLLEETMTKFGSEKPAFPTIVAFGSHTALPHHQPTTTKLRNNTPILIDFGATVQGYRSDMTRTWWFGDSPNSTFSQIEATVKTAYDAALATLRATAMPTAREVDAAARQVITEAGYGDHFIHTTGHGVGLDIHEQPSLNYRNETKIVPGMVITIEPGIYLEGKFGVRYENTVLVRKKRATELTITPAT